MRGCANITDLVLGVQVTIATLPGVAIVRMCCIMLNLINV